MRWRRFAMWRCRLAPPPKPLIESLSSTTSEFEALSIGYLIGFLGRITSNSAVSCFWPRCAFYLVGPGWAKEGTRGWGSAFGPFLTGAFVRMGSLCFTETHHGRFLFSEVLFVAL